MLSLGSARAAFLLFQNARVVTGAADSLSRYVVPLMREWSPTDVELRTLAEALGTRGDALAPSIEFLLQWGADKGSATAGALWLAQSTLARIESFLARSVESRMRQHNASGVKGAVAGVLNEGEKASLVHQMKHHLRELDFALAALNLAVSVVNASEACKPAGTAASAADASASSSSAPPRYISPSCLLRASERLRSTVGCSGDLSATFGSLYVQEQVVVPSTHAATTDAQFSAIVSCAVAEPDANPEGAGARWLQPMSAVADFPRGARQDNRNEAFMEAHFDTMPAGARWSEPDESKAEADPLEAEDEWARVSPTLRPATAPLPPPSSYSLPPPLPTPPPASNAGNMGAWQQLYPCASMKIVRAANTFELHLQSLTAASSDGLSRPSSSTLRFDLTGSLDFRSTSASALGLTDSLSAKQASSTDCVALFTFEERLASTVQRRYAFLMHAIEGDAASAAPSATPSSSLKNDGLRPLDIAYLARLAMYENLHVDSLPSSSSPASASAPVTAAGMWHTFATDEEMWLLLAGVHVQTTGLEGARESTAATGKPVTP